MSSLVPILCTRHIQYIQCTILLHPQKYFAPPCHPDEGILLGSVAFSKHLKGIFAPLLKPQDLVPRVSLAMLLATRKPNSSVVSFIPSGPKSSTDAEFRTGWSLLRQRCLFTWTVHSFLLQSFTPK